MAPENGDGPRLPDDGQPDGGARPNNSQSASQSRFERSTDALVRAALAELEQRRPAEAAVYAQLAQAVAIDDLRLALSSDRDLVDAVRALAGVAP